MSFAPIIQALALPPETRVEQRVPKKLLIENGAATASDKRQINDGIEEILWHAALKPANLGVPAYRDAVREYLEIAVITVTFRPMAKPGRLVDLIHRAIPYPVLLAGQQREAVSLSVAHKRWSQGETGKVVLEELRATAPFLPESPAAEEAQFLARLPVGGLPQRDLFALYQGWLDSVLALEAAQITGAFVPPSSNEHSMVLRETLDARVHALRELALLRAQAEKETQLNRRVELNLAIKSLNARIAEFDTNL
jgi:hypothetical protein